MSATMQSGFKTTLANEVNPTDTTLEVATAPTVTKGRIFLDNGAQQEWISFTGVSSTTLTGLTRGLSKTADPATAGTGLTWIAGTVAKIVAMHDQMADKTQAETISGAWSFTGANSHSKVETFSGAAAQVNMGGAKLGMRLPSLTTAERNALTPANGDLVYDSTIGANYQYINGAWGAVGAGTFSVSVYNTSTSKTSGVEYQANATGGMLVAISDNAAGPFTITILSDAGTPATVQVGRMFSNINSVPDGTVTVPILPNHYYKATVSAGATINYYDFQ